MKALVVEDDRVLADVVGFALRREGFSVIQAHDGSQALKQWAEEKPDIILLDINLPEVDGFTVCQHIRMQADTPIIMLSVRCDDEDIVRGLNLGADAYMTKPFSPRQLVARAHALLRRTGHAGKLEVLKTRPQLSATSRHEVSIAGGDPISLTPLEGRLLEFLMLNAGRMAAFDCIIHCVWGAEGGDRDMLRQLVRRLRVKIEPDPAHPRYILTTIGFGYSLAENHDLR